MFLSLFPDLFPVMVFCPGSQVMCSDYAITSHELFFYNDSLPSADLRRAAVIYNRKYVHRVLVNHLV